MDEIESSKEEEEWQGSFFSGVCLCALVWFSGDTAPCRMTVAV